MSIKPKANIRTLRVRIKDKHAKLFGSLAREVNTVWNYCNDLSFKVFQREHRFMSAYDFHEYTKGAAKEGLNLHSQTIQATSEEFVTRRKQFKKVKLNWRVSNPKSARRSLGWIPFKGSAIRYRQGQVMLFGHAISLWDSYGLAGFEMGSGSVSEDSRGRWYLNVTVSIPEFVGPPTMDQFTQSEQSIGIDLGLKDFLATSNGIKVQARQFYRGAQDKLATAQRANKKRCVKTIHAQIANRRKDFQHKLSTALVKQNGAIFIGNVNASGLSKTKMAKSVLDAGWSQFRDMLRTKCDHAGVMFEIVDEAYSTQDCSVCHTRSGPKGLKGLGIREWTCACGAHHDRDVNAARNILRRGRATLEVGIPLLTAQAAAVG